MLEIQRNLAKTISSIYVELCDMGLKKEKYILMSVYRRKTVLEPFMLSNFLKAKMQICTNKMY